jgi:hypothetical protein
MSRMVRTIRTLLAIRTSITVNLLIHSVQKLPLIGKLVRESAYANLELKRAVSVIAFLLTAVWGLALRFAYVGIIVYWPVAALGGESPEEQGLRHFVHLFAIISLAVACVSNATVLEPKREKYIAVKLMRMSPSRYMRASLGYRYVTFFIYLVPALLLFATLAGASIAEAVLLAAAATLWRVAAEYAHLKLFERTGVVLVKQNVIVWSVIILGYAAAYMPLLLDWTPATRAVLLSLPACLAMAASGIFAGVKLARYAGYREAVDAATHRDDPLLNLNKMIMDAEKQSVKGKDSDYDVEREQQGKPTAKEGYAYLNDIFFRRHRSLVRGPVNRRLAIIGGLGAAGVILTLLLQEQVQRLGWGLEVIFPLLGSLMYFMTVGEQLCKTMFYNSDLSLLRYGFYRNAAYEHYRIRFGIMLRMNLLIAAALGAALTAIAVSADAGRVGSELLLLWGCIGLLAVFFTVHPLFMYYYFQPYSTELNVKNPLFYVVNMVVSSVCGASIFLRPSGTLLAAIIAAGTVVYLLAAFVLVRRYGPRTFRVK